MSRTGRHWKQTHVFSSNAKMADWTEIVVLQMDDISVGGTHKLRKLENIASKLLPSWELPVSNTKSLKSKRV